MSETINRIKRNMNLKGVIKLICYPFKPIKRFAYRRRVFKNYIKLSSHYTEVIDDIRKSERRIRFGAYVVFDSTYGADGLFMLMKESNTWDPKIVIIPDISRGNDHMRAAYKQTKDFFVNRYGVDYVVDGYNFLQMESIDVSNEFDVIYCANPYDKMVDEVHSIEHLTKRQCLPLYISYGFYIGKKTMKALLEEPALNYLWRCYTDTIYSQQEHEKYQIIKGKNTELIGYSKMDKYYEDSIVRSNNIRILVSMHHTISMKELPLSNFLKYSDLIFELNEEYTDIDFVFRPHPLLFTTLLNKGIWTEENLKDYIDRMENSGIEYSVGGDYLELFANCDAIINDCGSFTVEWLYTGKPCCFMMNEGLNKSLLTKQMNKAIESYFVAYDKRDIELFIDNVKDKGRSRNIQEWVKEDIMINYPVVCEKMFDSLNQVLVKE